MTSAIRKHRLEEKNSAYDIGCTKKGVSIVLPSHLQKQHTPPLPFISTTVLKRLGIQTVGDFFFLKTI